MIAISAEDFVGGVTISVRSHEWAHVFPDDLLPGRHLENASPLTLADQCVATPKSLGAADMGAEEGVARPPLIFPDRLAGAGFEFDDPGKRVAIDITAIRE